jgi:hypothetical protein
MGQMPHSDGKSVLKNNNNPVEWVSYMYRLNGFSFNLHDLGDLIDYTSYLPLKKTEHPSRLESSYMCRHGVVITILSHKCKSFALSQNKAINHFWDCNYFALPTATGKNVIAIAIRFLCQSSGWCINTARFERMTTREI